MRTQQRKNRVHGYWLFTLLVIAVSGCPEREVERVVEWPQFEASPEELTATYERAIQRAGTKIETIVSQPASRLTFKSTVAALDSAGHDFHKEWNRIKLLQQASPTGALRDRAGELSVAMNNWYTEHWLLNAALYGRIKEFSQSPSASSLTGEDRRLMDETIALYEWVGITKSAEERALLRELRAQLAVHIRQIGANIGDAVGLVEFTREELAGLGEEQLTTLEYDAAAQRYRVKTALLAHYNLVMEHAEQPDTRRRALEARLDRAMADNGELIIDVLRVRAQIANLLGYANWAEYRAARHMAAGAVQAEQFIANVDERLDERFEREGLELVALKRDDLGDPTISELSLEDIPYYINKWRERDYQLDEDAVRQYFAADTTLRRLFNLYEREFSLAITVEAPPRTWAPGLQAAVVADAKSGRTLGVIYLDLYSRPGKSIQAAMFPLVLGKELTKYSYQAPVCAVVGDFPKPIGDRPALWSFAQVDSVVHNLGHALHEVVTQAKYAQLAGTMVPLDFVEMPSQFLERWLKDARILKQIAVHNQTGEPMPQEMAERLAAAASVAKGHYYKRQIALARSDFRIHMYSDPEAVPASPEALYAATNEDYNTYYPVPVDSGQLASFAHLFMGYDAGYYGYAWSDAIAADIASKFRQSQNGFMDKELGLLLREQILQVGNSRPVKASIRAFLGRDWNTNAFFEELVGTSQ
jgi:Zn-dependent oligopeptidase